MPPVGPSGRKTLSADQQWRQLRFRAGLLFFTLFAYMAGAKLGFYLQGHDRDFGLGSYGLLTSAFSWICWLSGGLWFLLAFICWLRYWDWRRRCGIILTGLAILWLTAMALDGAPYRLLRSTWGPSEETMPPVVALAASIAAVLLPTPRRYPYPRCRKCGYNLTGNASGACPECGHTTASPIPPHG